MILPPIGLLVSLAKLIPSIRGDSDRERKRWDKKMEIRKEVSK